MPTERDRNRDYLLREAERRPNGWEAINVTEFGIEGALDLLALQEGRYWEIDLRHKPFARYPDLKRLSLEARAADLRLNRLVCEIQSDTWDRHREKA